MEDVTEDQQYVMTLMEVSNANAVQLINLTLKTSISVSVWFLYKKDCPIHQYSQYNNVIIIMRSVLEEEHNYSF